MIRLSGLRVTYRATGARALDGLSFEVRAGERLVVLGPSGCGKTTALRALLGLLRPEEALIEGAVERGGARVSAVFQRPALFPWMSVRANAAFPLKASGRLAEDRGGALTTPLLRMCGLEGEAGRLPHQLSAGMRQRVSLARALVAEPDLVVMDEPFASLDPGTKAQVLRDTRALLEARSVTALLVTHDLEEALALGDRLVVLTGAPGRVKAEYALEGRSPAERAALAGELAGHYAG